jgi:hypothetical protein
MGKSEPPRVSSTRRPLKQLSQAGVEVIEYVQGKSLTPKNYLDKMMSAIQAGTDAAHREASSVAVHLAHTRKHHAGYVVGGRVFGYRNEHVAGTDAHGNFLKSHTARVIDPTEAAVVTYFHALRGRPPTETDRHAAHA